MEHQKLKRKFFNNNDKKNPAEIFNRICFFFEGKFNLLKIACRSQNGTEPHFSAFSRTLH